MSWCAITDYFDLPGVSFFWVEEVGEFALCWLTFIGAAVAILERTHFALAVLTHRFPPPLQRLVERVNYLLIAGFGAATAFYGWKVSAMNAMLVSPALSINLGFLFFSAGGQRRADRALRARCRLRPHQAARYRDPNGTGVGACCSR